MRRRRLVAWRRRAPASPPRQATGREEEGRGGAEEGLVHVDAAGEQPDGCHRRWLGPPLLDRLARLARGLSD